MFSEGCLKSLYRLLCILILRRVFILRIDEGNLLQILNRRLEIPQTLINQRQIMIDIGNLRRILTELILPKLGRILKHHKRNLRLPQQMKNNPQIIITIASHIAPQLGRSHKTRNSLIILMPFHKMRAHHKIAIRSLVRISAEHFLDMLCIDFVHLYYGLFYYVEDVCDGGD